MFIYYLWERSRINSKIGSTCDFKKRSGGYITSCDDFDNNTHEIILFTIIESKYRGCFNWRLIYFLQQVVYYFTFCKKVIYYFTFCKKVIYQFLII